MIVSDPAIAPGIEPVDANEAPTAGFVTLLYPVAGSIPFHCAVFESFFLAISILFAQSPEKIPERPARCLFRIRSNSRDPVTPAFTFAKNTLALRPRCCVYWRDSPAVCFGSYLNNLVFSSFHPK
jgi:hypothetical protein